MCKQCRNPRMDTHEIDGDEVINGVVTPTGNGAHVLVPKRWIGADVKVVRTSDPVPEVQSE